MQYFPDNTLANFKTHLARKLYLGNAGEWEVGLAEIQYPRNWLNFPSPDGWDAVVCPKIPSPDELKTLEGKLQPSDYETKKELIVPPGYYQAVPDLLEVMNGRLAPHVKLRWEHYAKRVKAIIKPHKALFLNDRLQKLLGLGKRLYSRNDKEAIIRGEFVSDYLPDYSNMYVYCNLAQHRPVGDTEAPLLRIVPVTGHFGSFTAHICEDVHFVPTTGGETDMVEIDIRDDTGKPFPFESGKLVVVLQLRKRKASFL